MQKWTQDLLISYPDLSDCAADIEQAYRIMAEQFHKGHKLLVCGNGGSAADCEHIVGELMKSFTMRRAIPESLKIGLQSESDGSYIAEHLQQALPAISLVSQSGLYTAFSNDVQPDLVFAQQVYGYGQPGDMLLGLSTSGNSRNVVYACEVAKALGLHTIGLTGKQGGQMARYCDAVVRVPYESTAQVQERHLPIYHAFCLALEEEFFG